MAKLSNSIAKETVRKKNIVDKFYGAFKSEKTAEEIIDEIKNSRNFNRTIEAF